MAIDPAVQYSSSNDGIIGLDHYRSEVANQLLVFMIRGAHTNWSQPVGYFLVSHSIEAAVLKDLIYEGILKAHDAGIQVSRLDSNNV